MSLRMNKLCTVYQQQRKRDNIHTYMWAHFHNLSLFWSVNKCLWLTWNYKFNQYYSQIQKQLRHNISSKTGSTVKHPDAVYYFFCSDKDMFIFVSGRFDKLKCPCNVSTRLKKSQKEVNTCWVYEQFESRAIIRSRCLIYIFNDMQKWLALLSSSRPTLCFALIS